jgi:peptidyl-prolyl cis-trans isomerase A (cyclophilin A)
MKAIVSILVLGSALLAQTPAPTKSAAPAAQSNAALLNPASLTAKAPDVFDVKFSTSAGDFVIQVHRAWAPIGADRFYNLAKNNFFDNAAFFRVIPGFMAQFGIPADPRVARVWQSANIKDDPVKQSNGPGYVTFATAGPNTRTTQLFINLGDNSRLDKDGFTPFGKVTEGMEIVRKIYGGYGEGAPGGNGPAQERVQTQGKAYLDKSFPKLDFIKSTTVTETPAAAPAKK